MIAEALPATNILHVNAIFFKCMVNKKDAKMYIILDVMQSQ